MAHSDLEKANEKIAQKAADSLQKLEKAVVDGYNKVEETVVGSYNKVENAVVGQYTKIEDAFVDHYLTHDGETVADAKARLKQAAQGDDRSR